MQKPKREQLQEMFDYIDGNLYHKQKKQRVKVGMKAGSIDAYGYLIINIKGKKYKAHHLVWAYHYDMYPSMIDHIDGNPSNNHIHNLRIATASQNQMNRKLNKNNRYGVKGLYQLPSMSWATQIRFNNKIIFKSFKEKSEAIQFLNTVRTKLHGDYARFQ